MSLSAGVRLGPYEIQSAIGSGGMGEVYKARDTRLERTVAIKVLPSHVAADPDLRQRFEREARAVAALNHPHICTLHDIGSQDGVDFLVLEYLDGETLAERLASVASGFSRTSPAGSKGPGLPVAEALSIAMQIADALDKAHRQGIVHRDLKPSNIMLVRGGGASAPPTVKLLDFGLAKTSGVGRGLVSRPAGRAGSQEQDPAYGASALPTTPPNLTAQGTILGTFQYMAPEQLEGKDADTRTDIFAFGAVLYEMLTGRKAFEGKSQASLIGAILKDTPPPISEQLSIAGGKRLRPLPSAETRGSSERGWGPASIEMLDRVVSTCLAKDPEDRWQTARDLLRELKWVAQGRLENAGQAGAAPVVTRRKGRERLAWAVAALALVGVAALAVPAARYFRPAPIDAPEMRLEITTPTTTDPVSLAISPDEQKIVFAATSGGRSQLWLRPLDSVSARPLAETEGAQYPFWSPDSRSIGFLADNRLKRIDINAGSVQTLANAPGLRGGAWNRDGVILFNRSTGGPIFRISATGGEPAAVTQLQMPQQSGHRFPQFLPDGRHFLYYVTGTPDARGVYIGQLDGPETQRLLDADAGAAYTSSGQLLFVRQGTLFGQNFDAVRLGVTGDPFPVAEQLTVNTLENVAALSASAGGAIVYRTGSAGGQQQFLWLDRSGKEVGRVGDPDSARLGSPSISPDGRRVALYRTVRGNTDVWLLDLGRGVLGRFTLDAAQDTMPVWSPDGSRIVFSSNRTGGTDLYQKPATGAGNEELLVATAQFKVAADWSRDGRFLLYRSLDPKMGYDLWALPMDEDRKPFPVVQTSFEERDGQFSPDGKWIAYQSNESGRVEIYVQPFPGPGGKWQVSTNGGAQVRWRPDGEELFYIALDGGLMAVQIRLASNGQTTEAGAPVPLFATRVGGAVQGFNRQSYMVSPDGQRFLMNTISEEATSPITVVLNWADWGESKKCKV